MELLDKYGHMPYNAHIRRQMLAMTIESANATGDKDKELTAFREYSSILEQTLESRMVEKYKELEIVYNLHKLKAEHARGTWQLHKKNADSCRCRGRNFIHSVSACGASLASCKKNWQRKFQKLMLIFG